MFLQKGKQLAQRRRDRLLDIIAGETHQKPEAKSNEDHCITTLAGNVFTSRRTERNFRALITKTCRKAVERSKRSCVTGTFDDGISAINSV
jgi:hypothetical protein